MKKSQLFKNGKKFIFMPFILAGLTIISCASGQSAAFLDKELLAAGSVELGEVQVTVDQVLDKALASQLSTLACNALNSNSFNQENEKNILLEISVNQRSFLQSAAMKNAIFLNFVFSEKETNEQISVITEYTSGNETIYSAKVQQKYLTKALNEYFRQKNTRKK